MGLSHGSRHVFRRAPSTMVDNAGNKPYNQKTSSPGPRTLSKTVVTLTSKVHRIQQVNV